MPRDRINKMSRKAAEHAEIDRNDVMRRPTQNRKEVSREAAKKHQD
jgi:hypothetical protein